MSPHRLPTFAGFMLAAARLPILLVHESSQLVRLGVRVALGFSALSLTVLLAATAGMFSWRAIEWLWRTFFSNPWGA